MSKPLTRIIVAAAALVVSGCSINATRPQGLQVSELRLYITGGSNVMTVGDVTQTSLRALLSDDREVTVTPQSELTSLDPAVVTVTPEGVVTAVGAGVTKVQATYLGTTTESTFTVNEP